MNVVDMPPSYWCSQNTNLNFQYSLENISSNYESNMVHQSLSPTMQNNSVCDFESPSLVNNFQQVPYSNGYENDFSMNYPVIQDNTGFYSENIAPFPPPCQGPQPWNYAYCYGYYGEPPCQFSNVVDMEDFMNNEKRKEKSRDAARNRRTKETKIFTELGQVLPVRQEEIDQLDKASIMRLSISYLKVRQMTDLFPEMNKKSKESNTELKQKKEFKLPKNIEYLIQALDGFLLVLSGDGDVTFVTENVQEFLGISQIDLMGQPIWDYSHQCDHDELREALIGRRASRSEVQNGKIGDDVQPMVHRDFFLRLKCTLTSRGRSVNIKSASYKVIHVTGHILANEGQRQLISVCCPLPHPSNIEIPMGSSTFLTKHSLDMKFSYVDDKLFPLLGYHPSDLCGKSLYEYHHGEDSESLLSTFKSHKKGREEKISMEQKEIFVSYMEENRLFRSKKCTDQSVDYLWEEVTTLLNSAKGPKKTKSDWGKTFDNWRYSVNFKARTFKEGLLKTGGGTSKAKPLNELELRAQSCWGKVVVDGCPGVEELGFETIETIYLDGSEIETVDVNHISGSPSAIPPSLQDTPRRDENNRPKSDREFNSFIVKIENQRSLEHEQIREELKDINKNLEKLNINIERLANGVLSLAEKRGHIVP